MKRDFARIIAIAGAVVVIISIIWENARMQPDNNYFVDPWAIRGFQSIHGIVFASIGVALLLAVLAVSSSYITEAKHSIYVVAGMVLAATVITGVFAGDETVRLRSNSIATTGFTLLLAYTIYRGLGRWAQRESVANREANAVWFKGGRGIIILIVIALVTLFIVRTFVTQVLDNSFSVNPAVGMFLLMGVFGVMVSFMNPTIMAASRMLLIAPLVAGTAIGFSAAAIRSTLIRHQAELVTNGVQGIPGQYRDTQVTWGYFLANIGVVLVFIGAVMMWARRRDIVQAQQRAAKQRAAAEESAAELANAE